MEQVGYDMYCKLLDEVVKEIKGENLAEEIDVQIDLNVSSYIPDDFTDSSSQKIEIYQNIASCKNEENIQNVIDQIIDIYGQMPVEIENLIEIARIKNLAREKFVVKIIQKGNNIIYYFDEKNFNVDCIEKLMKIYKGNIKFSPSQINPYITIKIENNYDILTECKKFITNL